MTTTASLHDPPEYLTSEESCVAYEEARKRKQGNETWDAFNARTVTNPRYKEYRQSVFHAGDSEQFDQFRDETNGDVCIQDIETSELVSDWPSEVWGGYRSPTAVTCQNTFDYIFHKFKKGIFVKIVGGELRVFLPFSKNRFRNEWGDRIEADPKKFRDVTAFLQYVNSLTNIERKKAGVYEYPFKRDKVNADTSAWYANNCIVRFENPINEGDSNVLNVKNMLETLCNEREVPDIEFFMNRRDFPLLTKDGTEAYDALFGPNQPLLSHRYDRYLPILSMSKTSKYADVLAPTHEDWARVQSRDDKWFPPCRRYDGDFSTPWSERKPTAVFRGATTGCGITIDTNPRLKLAYIASVTPSDHDGIPILDAGITSFNLRPRKVSGDPYLRTIEPENLPFGTIGRLSPSEQSTYKYIINVDGHVSAFRLSYEMSMGSTLLLIGSPWKIWFTDMLQPYVHYIPVLEDMSNLVKQVKWCRAHDAECEEIAMNALAFFNKYLQKDGILDYMQKTLVDLKQAMGVYLYNVVTPLDAQLTEERIAVSKPWYPETDKGFDTISAVPRGGRTYGSLRGLQWVINMVNKAGKFLDLSAHISTIFTNKLGVVSGYSLAGAALAVKTTKDPHKTREHVHETYVGTKEINELSKSVPNFVYIYGSYEGEAGDYNVVTEYIPGESLGQYINGPNFQFQEFLMVLLQICLALEVAQNRCAFVHWDLLPWNIMLQPKSNATTYDYLLRHDTVYRVETKLVPVIIDYGKAHVIHKGEHHGLINMYRTSTIQDALSIVARSLADILKRNNDKRNSFRLPSHDLTSAFRLAEFIIGPDHGLNASTLEYRMVEEARYQNLTGSGKGILEKLGPMDLFRHIKKLNYRFSVKPAVVYNSVMDRDNARQVFDYILSPTVESKAKSYLDVFERLKLCTLPKPKNLFFVYYAAQTMYDSLLSVRDSMMTFTKRVNVDSAPFEQAFDGAAAYLDEWYGKIITESPEREVRYLLYDFEHLKPAPYTEKTFLLPEQVLELEDLYEYDKTELYDLSGYKDMVQLVIANDGVYKLSEEHRKFYMSNFSELLEVSGVNMINNSATQPTLHAVVSRVYSQDLKVLSEELGDRDCEDAQRYLEMYQELVETVDV